MPLPEIVNGSWLMVHRFRKETTNYELQTTNRKSRGFTLIELLVVISIIAILMAVATVSYTNAQQKSRDNKRKSDLKAVQQALELYFQQNGKYPSGPSGDITCNVTGDLTAQPWGTEFDCTETNKPKITYMNPLPKDQINVAASNKYYYAPSATFDQYVIATVIENSKDPDIAPTVTQPCTTPSYSWFTLSSPRNFCVVNP